MLTNYQDSLKTKKDLIALVVKLKINQQFTVNHMMQIYIIKNLQATLSMWKAAVTDKEMFTCLIFLSLFLLDVAHLCNVFSCTIH